MKMADACPSPSHLKLGKDYETTLDAGISVFNNKSTSHESESTNAAQNSVIIAVHDSALYTDSKLEQCTFTAEHDDWDQFSDRLEHKLLNKEYKNNVNQIDRERIMMLNRALLRRDITSNDIHIINSVIKEGVSIDAHHFNMYFMDYLHPHPIERHHSTYIYNGTPLIMAIHNPAIPLRVVESLISTNNINKVLKNFPDQLVHNIDGQTLATLNTVIENAVNSETFWYPHNYPFCHRTETSRSELVSLLLQYGAEVPGLHAVFEENSYNLRKDGLQFQSALTIRRAIKVKKSMDVYTSLKKLPSSLIEYCTLRDFNEEVIEKLKGPPCPTHGVAFKAFKDQFRMGQNENVSYCNGHY